MLKNSIYKIISIFIISLIIANSANAQIDANSLAFSFTEGNQENISGFDDSMDQSPIINSVSLTNTDITDVFQIINARTQWSIFPTNEVSKVKINLFAQEITAMKLLETVVEMTGFLYHKEGNIITVMTYEEYAQYYGLAKQVVTLKYGNVDSISAVLNTFLSKLGKSIVYSETNSIVIFESKANLETIINVIDQLDIPSDSQTAINVINLVYMDAEELANTLQSIFSEQEENQNNKRKQMSEPSENQQFGRITPSENNIDSSFSTPYSNVGIFPLSSSNKLIVKASKSDMEEIEKLIEKLDIFIEPITRTYHFTYIDAGDIYSDLENILDIRTGNNRYSRSRGGQNSREGGRPGGLTLVEKTNSILVTGPPSVHRVMDSIKEEVDVAATYETGEIRTYKLNNADLEEVAATIRELLDSKQREEERTGESRFTTTPDSTPETSGNIDLAQTEEYIPQIEATVAVNQSTNSIVIRATARQHRELGKLIEELDERRRQVQIKAMIIEVTTNDDTDFGIELDYINRDTINFTSFGLSTIDPTTGIRDIIVSPGGAAAVLNPGRFQTIVKALQGNDNIRIESSPQLLVDDNAEGIIQSIAEQPTRQTNQGENTTTTSFGEYVSAGTQFYVTPHISEFNYLRVQYEIVLNSFGEQAASDLPPARSTSNITSVATVPNGYTIVVGGIQSSKDSESVDKIPLLGDIPGLGMLFRNTVIRKQHITTYLFITTTIIESEDFKDIVKISDEVLSDMGKEVNNITDPNEDNAQTE
ncbi:MAG: hypothetical protein JXA96_16795 [Sedimentisphaerales bacterium]|nr:hypothetical protein [Sedimentisphaerales bacterium]